MNSLFSNVSWRPVVWKQIQRFNLPFAVLLSATLFTIVVFITQPSTTILMQSYPRLSRLFHTKLLISFSFLSLSSPAPLHDSYSPSFSPIWALFVDVGPCWPLSDGSRQKPFVVQPIITRWPVRSTFEKWFALFIRRMCFAHPFLAREHEPFSTACFLFVVFAIRHPFCSSFLSSFLLLSTAASAKKPPPHHHP